MGRKGVKTMEVYVHMFTGEPGVILVLNDVNREG